LFTDQKYQEISKINLDDVFRSFGDIEFYKYDKKSKREDKKMYWA
jgi:hypothetical protein